MPDAKDRRTTEAVTLGGSPAPTEKRLLFQENTAGFPAQSPMGRSVGAVSNQASILDLALAYHARGWAIIEIPFGKKAPNRKNWQNEKHDERSIQRVFGFGRHNIGVLLGSKSGNLVDCDQDHLMLAPIIDKFLPATGARFGRPSKPGGHRLYTCDSLPKSEKFVDPIPVAQGGMGTIGEIRTDGGQTVLPGSFHEASGEVVEWEQYGEPATVDGEQLRSMYAEACALALLQHHFPGEGARHDAALALAGGWLRAGRDESGLTRLLEYCWPSAESGQIDGIVRLTSEKLENTGKITGWPTLAEHINPKVVRKIREWLGIKSSWEQPRLTDFGNSERFIAQHGRNVRYCSLWGQWLIWDENRWAIDSTGIVKEWAKETIRLILNEAKDESDADRRAKILRWAAASEQGGRLETMLRLAQTVRGIAITPDDLDQHRWLLNVANGTLDLQKLELRAARREDLLTKVMPVAYLPNTECPTWERFIDSVTRDREDREQVGLAGYLQRLVGYLLTGDTTEKMLPMLWGPGDTGKTTFTEIILNLLGNDYGMTTSESTIAARSRGQDSIPNDLAALRGSRLVVISETTEGLQLNEGRIKAMTGRNQIAARFLHQEWFTFVPEFKLLVETNHRPHIKGTDSAIWNRVKPIPFVHVIPKDQQDKQLPEKLRAELPGILNWALVGLADWMQHGMGEPTVVKEANSEYREQSDILGEFLAETCEIDPAKRVKSGALYSEYHSFMEARGLRPLGDQKFTEVMKERGFEKRKVKGYPTWFGVAVKVLALASVGGVPTSTNFPNLIPTPRATPE